MQQNDFQVMKQVLIDQILLKKIDLANFRSDVDKSDIDKWKNVPTGLNSFESKVDKLDFGKLVPLSVHLIKQK